MRKWILTGVVGGDRDHSRRLIRYGGRNLYPVSRRGTTVSMRAVTRTSKVWSIGRVLTASPKSYMD